MKERFIKNSVYVNYNRFFDPFNNYETDVGGFLISKYHFTNKNLIDIIQYLDFVNREGGFYHLFNDYSPSLHIKYDEESHTYSIDSGFENHPAVGLNWTGSCIISTIFGARIPTELEWVYCATSNQSNNIYPWGELEPNSSFANYSEQVGETTPVGLYAPNKFGIYDMAGNAEEWCSDWYIKDMPYSGDRILNNLTQLTEKVVKGGGWNKEEEKMNCFARRGKFYRIGTHSIGFRLLWDNVG